MLNEERKKRGHHAVGVMVMLCDRGDGGGWQPLMKVGNPLAKGVYKFKCRDLGVDPCMTLVDEATITFERILDETKATPPGQYFNHAPVPIYFNSRTQVYMHC